MRLNDPQATLALSRFAKQAKPDLGDINLTELASDADYATEVVMKCMYMQQPALLISAKNIAEILHLDLPLLSAVELYVAFMHKRDLQDELSLHWEHLLGLRYFLKDCEATPTNYRNQIAAYTKHLEADENEACIILARTFFPFWLQARNPVYANEHLNNLKTKSIDDEALRDLVVQWNSITSVELVMLEQVLLSQYTQALEHLRFYPQAIAEREKIVRFLMVILREEDKSQTNHYRLAVDKVHSVVMRHDFKNTMVEVCREFYPFWQQEADAAQKLRARVKQREKEESI